MKRLSNWIFDLGAPIYALGTNQVVWRASGAELARHFPPTRGLLVLDLGTGPAISIAAMHRARPDTRFVGLDISAGMLAQARRRLQIEARSDAPTLVASLVRADAAALPFAGAAFAVVTGHSFLYLLPDPVAALRETRRVLQLGGSAIFMEPHAAPVHLGSLLHELRHVRYLITMAGWRLFSALHRRYTPQRFAAEAEAAGLIPLATRPVLHNLGLICLARRPEHRDHTGNE
ncbi:MAG: methyltransferase domain-containing protein [Ardenticatenaceae bacterium]|nr:methyltransferase domain-containing protein [Ardenticatenaceae bacterium]